MKTTDVKIIYLEGRLDDVERELSIITSKKYELEQRRKTLLEKINKLDEERETVIRKIEIARIDKRNGL
jgi:cell division septum initiation protein DivIVA